jgi:hypothetical protein
MANPRAQIGLWPTPRGGFSVADAHAIKVSEYHGDISNSIATDRWPPIGIGIDGRMPIDHIQLAPEIPQACGGLQDSPVFRE